MHGLRRRPGIFANPLANLQPNYHTEENDHAKASRHEQSHTGRNSRRLSLNLLGHHPEYQPGVNLPYSAQAPEPFGFVEGRGRELK
jgi:hypothetical protein